MGCYICRRALYAVIVMEDICMKKIVFSIFLLILFIGSCAAQNANNAQKIIGTWIDTTDTTWTFKSDGTFGNDQGKYSVADTKLIILTTNGNLSLYSIFISDNGKTLIIIRERFYSVNDKRFYAGDSQNLFYWCTKK
jgi:hypothetical protein